jgi:hypothetical protein
MPAYESSKRRSVEEIRLMQSVAPIGAAQRPQGPAVAPDFTGTINRQATYIVVAAGGSLG